MERQTNLPEVFEECMRRACAVLGAMGPVVIKDIEDKTGLSMGKWWKNLKTGGRHTLVPSETRAAALVFALGFGFCGRKI